jgi:hypothetical protein
MATDFDRLVEELQQQVLEDARTLYSHKVVADKAPSEWRHPEEFYNPKNLGRMSEPDARGIVQGLAVNTLREAADRRLRLQIGPAVTWKRIDDIRACSIIRCERCTMCTSSPS